MPALEIQAIEAIPITIPLPRAIRMAVATVDHRDSVLVRVRTRDGLQGWGEAVPAPYFTGETQAGACHAITHLLGPALLGLNAFNLQGAVRRMDRALTGNPAAKAAVDVALHDLVARAFGVPLYQLLGGKVRDRVWATWYVSASDPEEAADEARAGVEQGFRGFKIKVGVESVRVDLERLRAVRQATGPQIPLRADANQAWSPGDAIRWLIQAAEFGLQFVEQPVKRDDLAGMARVAQAVDTPVAPDEGLWDANDAMQHIRAGACGGIVLKVVKCGGLVGAQRLAAVAQAANLALHLCGMPGETSICAAAGLHLAVALPELAWDTGFYPHLAVVDPVVERLLPERGSFVPPEGPGLGIEIDEGAVERCRTDRRV